MAQFDVYKNPNKMLAEEFPYLLDIQNDLHSSLSSRLVVPLARGMKPVKHLAPLFEIEGINVVMSTMDMTSVSVDVFGVFVVNIEKHRTEIVDALDFLVNGF